jgi:hypothetical protein
MIERPEPVPLMQMLITGDVKQDAKQLEEAALDFLNFHGTDRANMFQQELQAMADKGPEYLKQVFDQMGQDSNKNGNGAITVSPDHLSISFDSPYPSHQGEITGTVSGNQANVSTKMSDLLITPGQLSSKQMEMQ